MNNDINPNQGQNQNNQNNQNRPPHKKTGSDFAPKKPAPPKSSPPVPTGINRQNQAAQKTAQDANMADGFQSGQTRTFDTSRDAVPNPGRPIQKDSRNSEGTYHYTGRDIKSSRQRVTDTGSNPTVGRRNAPRDGEMTVSPNKEKNRRKHEIESKRDGFVISGILKVVLYIAGVLIVAAILSYNIIMIANDVFAFVKTPVLASVTIPEDADIEKISQILYDNDIIKYPRIFNFYINYRKKDKVWEYEPGTYNVSSDLNYDNLIYMFRKKAAERVTVRITIPEGFTIDQIIDRFVEENGIGTREKFVEIINNYDFSELGYRFLKPLYENKDYLSDDRKYMLEGYLFPDTYDFYTDESEINIIIRFLNNFSSKFTESFYKQCELLNMSIDDIIILASMVEREAKFPEDFAPIAAVFHNRLINPSAFGGLLQSDATVLYDLAEHKADLTQADLAVDSPYNTYTRKGLPPSAICNPGYEAIFSTLWPEEKSPYYYFIADMNGKVFYSETLAQHEAHRERIRQEKAAAAVQP